MKNKNDVCGQKNSWQDIESRDIILLVGNMKTLTDDMYETKYRELKATFKIINKTAYN